MNYMKLILGVRSNQHNPNISIGLGY